MFKLKDGSKSKTVPADYTGIAVEGDCSFSFLAGFFHSTVRPAYGNQWRYKGRLHNTKGPALVRRTGEEYYIQRKLITTKTKVVLVCLR